MLARWWDGDHLPVIDEKCTKYGEIPCMRKHEMYIPRTDLWNCCL